MARSYNNKLTNELKTFLKQKGADLIGVAPAERMKDAPEGHRPTDLLPNARSVIVLAKHLIDSHIERLSAEDPTLRRYARMVYTAFCFDGTNATLFRMAHEGSILLERRGYYAFPIHPTYPYDPEKFFGVFSHRHAAVAAGLGQFGKSGVVLTPQYGPRQRFISILSTASLVPDPPLAGRLCTDCGECVKSCPVHAFDSTYDFIEEKGRFYKPLCAHYNRWDPKTQRCSYICGLCLATCPIGKESTNLT